MHEGEDFLRLLDGLVQIRKAEVRPVDHLVDVFFRVARLTQRLQGLLQRRAEVLHDFLDAPVGELLLALHVVFFPDNGRLVGLSLRGRAFRGSLGSC